MAAMIGHDTPSSTMALALGQIARQGGGIILKIIESGLTHFKKPDGSPCSNADLAAEAVIMAELTRAFPQIPAITEESLNVSGSLGGRFFLVDPLDGTRDFMAGRREFTVNIALIEETVPVAGAIFAPLLGRLWVGGAGAWAADVDPGDGPVPQNAWRRLRTRRAPRDGLVALESLRHSDAETDRFLARLPVRERRKIPSSMKFCLVAEGDADVYARFGPTMEWDTAAGDAILRAAGGRVMRPSGAPLSYGKVARGFCNDAFVAWGDPEFAKRYYSPDQRS